MPATIGSAMVLEIWYHMHDHLIFKKWNIIMLLNGYNITIHMSWCASLFRDGLGIWKHGPKCCDSWSITMCQHVQESTVVTWRVFCYSSQKNFQVQYHHP